MIPQNLSLQCTHTHTKKITIYINVFLLFYIFSPCLEKTNSYFLVTSKTFFLTSSSFLCFLLNSSHLFGNKSPLHQIIQSLYSMVTWHAFVISLSLIMLPWHFSLVSNFLVYEAKHAHDLNHFFFLSHHFFNFPILSLMPVTDIL